MTTSPDRITNVARRRTVFGLLGGTSILAASGCCNLRPFAAPQVAAPDPGNVEPALRPRRVVKAAGVPAFCVDTHAHFFNASDVPVAGYLKGPVAHSADPRLRALIEFLAPVADALAGIAPTAADEYAELRTMGTRVRALDATARFEALQKAADTHRENQAKRAYELLRGTPFETEFNRLKQEQRKVAPLRATDGDLAPLNAQSFTNAVKAGRQPRGVRVSAFREGELGQAAYPDGVLAFVTYMLSYRWANLHDYADAFTSSDAAFGIDVTLGALVDFDHWLECPPRSAHEDQVEVHRLLAALSGGYMRPLVAYNPWSDVVLQGKALTRVMDVLRDSRFVGVKIYPPNGFMPLGNETITAPIGVGQPSRRDIETRMEVFWDAMAQVGVPVLAHTNESMGKDAEHDTYGGPAGWRLVAARYPGKSPAPIVSLGHFGGDTKDNTWTREMGDLMSEAGPGARFFADVGYWDRLRCVYAGKEACDVAAQRLSDAVKGRQAAQRVMYGSDWLMLSKEPFWADFAAEVLEATRDVVDPVLVFGQNARSCFTRI